jgi:DNA-binding response OmpR family regulator
VLVLDDDIAILDIVKMYLDDDYDVTVTDCPDQCLDLLARNVYDLILTDLRMPEMSGFEVINRIRKDNSLFPILVVSGFVEEKKLRALNDPSLFWIVKPIECEDLMHRVQEIVKSFGGQRVPVLCKAEKESDPLIRRG